MPSKPAPVVWLCDRCLNHLGGLVGGWGILSCVQSRMELVATIQRRWKVSSSEASLAASPNPETDESGWPSKKQNLIDKS